MHHILSKFCLIEAVLKEKEGGGVGGKRGREENF
jgi:hypothetical protein